MLKLEIENKNTEANKDVARSIININEPESEIVGYSSLMYQNFIVIKLVASDVDYPDPHNDTTIAHTSLTEFVVESI
uniref:Uncharacterized protein n=1 Tax=Panagrolaimus sp. PS1159 TaxID=55785 RepID=A0AC35F6Z6_9BILA